MAYIPSPPKNIHVASISSKPISINLQWEITNDEQLHTDYLYSNIFSVERILFSNRTNCLSAVIGQHSLRFAAFFDSDVLSAVLGINPAYISGHKRSISGYRIHRGNMPGFVPTGESKGQGNCISDETELFQNVIAYQDTDVSRGQRLYYKMCQIINL